ncbi:hypothetical protein [Oceanibaculum pacificum]|uniref:hypothetical protein n=1 Tax=Oceanibaculum pacificum TaxID=580166 RepID=UPI0012ECCBDA|nr:hypothetical protein [Oceanibaculum pacificum]
MGKVKQDIHRRKAKKNFFQLKKMLGQCDDYDFLQLCWAITMLQSDRKINVDNYLKYPADAKTTNPGTEYSVYNWEIETIVNILFTTSKTKIDKQKYPRDNFYTMAQAINILRAVEDNYSGYTLNEDNIFEELHRIGHRQFGWQRGFSNTERFYRFLYIYAQGN